jgi:hypothetical protein
MVLFGGHDGTRHLADVHLFDFVSQAWSMLAAQGVPPLPRDSHVSVSYKDSMYVFGGEQPLYEILFGLKVSNFAYSLLIGCPKARLDQQ